MYVKDVEIANTGHLCNIIGDTDIWNKNYLNEITLYMVLKGMFSSGVEGASS